MGTGGVRDAVGSRGWDGRMGQTAAMVGASRPDGIDAPSFPIQPCSKSSLPPPFSGLRHQVQAHGRSAPTVWRSILRMLAGLSTPLPEELLSQDSLFSCLCALDEWNQVQQHMEEKPKVTVVETSEKQEKVVVLHFMSQLGWDTGCPDICLNVILGVSVRVFLVEINI